MGLTAPRALALALALGACGDGARDPADATDTTDATPDTTDDTTDATTATDAADVAAPAAWDPAPAPVACAPDRPAALLDEVLAAAGLTRATFGFSAADYAASAYASAGHLDDAFRLPWFRAAQARPAEAACLGSDVAGALDALAAGPHPVAAMIRHAARGSIVGRRRRRGRRAGADADGPPSSDLLAALVAAHAAAGLAWAPEAGVGPDLGLPADLAAALVPVVDALAEVVAAHARWSRARPSRRRRCSSTRAAWGSRGRGSSRSSSRSRCATTRSAPRRARRSTSRPRAWRGRSRPSTGRAFAGARAWRSTSRRRWAASS